MVSEQGSRKHSERNETGEASGEPTVENEKMTDERVGSNSGTAAGDRVERPAASDDVDGGVSARASARDVSPPARDASSPARDTSAPARDSSAPARDSSTPDRDAFGYRDLHLEVSGKEDGEPILLLHGWGSSAENMRIIAQALSAEYRIYNLDLPGHGHSPAPPQAMGVPEHAGIVADLIRNEMNLPVTIVGHSNGGRIALYMASDANYKSLIRRLLLISPSGITPQRSAGYYIKRTMSRILKAPFEILPEPLREFGLDWLRHSLVWRVLGSSDYRALEGTMRESFVKTVTHHVDDRVSNIEVPTLLVWGDKDTAVSRRQMEILEDRIPDSGLLVLENAGHYGYIDDFDTFIGGARYFLQNS